MKRFNHVLDTARRVQFNPLFRLNYPFIIKPNTEAT